MELRKYQNELISNVYLDCKTGLRNICVVLPCGGGKTVVMSEIIKRANKKGNKVLFLVHTRELIKQAKDTFEAVGISMQVIEGKIDIDDESMAILSTVQTMCNRIKKNPELAQNFKMIMIDECHHIQSSSYRQIIDNCKNSFIFGFTATPARLDGKSLGDIFQKLEIGVSVKELIKMGFLTPFDYYLPPQKFDEKELTVKFADFAKDDMELVLDKQYIIKDIVEKYNQLAKDKKTIVYAVSIKHANNIQKEFKEAGINSAVITANTPEMVREALIKSFKAGYTKILINVDLFSEGFDVPSCECVILCRPTMSLTLFIQQSMRSMRIDRNNPSKRAVIIDLVGNAYRFGLPDNEFDWSLTESIKKKKRKTEENTVKIRTCKHCYAVFEISKNKCPICGADYTADNKKREMEKVEAELKKVEEIQIKNDKIADKKKIRCYNDLIWYANKYHYKQGWVYYQAKLRRYI